MRILSLKSTLLDSGIRDLKNEGNHASYVSWLKIRQDFDSGKKDTVTFEVLMYGKLSMQPLTEMNITGTKLVRESAGFDKSREHVQVVSRDKFVEASYYERYFVVHYNYGTTSTLFQHVEAVYNDGFTSIDFPCIKYTDIKNNGCTAAGFLPEKTTTAATASTSLPSGSVQRLNRILTAKETRSACF